MIFGSVDFVDSIYPIAIIVAFVVYSYSDRILSDCIKTYPDFHNIEMNFLLLHEAYDEP